jgi:hypothetical protein
MLLSQERAAESGRSFHLVTGRLDSQLTAIHQAHMPNELLVQNTPLALAINIGALIWSRNDFRMPRLLPVPPHSIRRLLVAVGWFLVVAVVIRSVGGQFGDARVAIANSGQMYAHRGLEPLLFWGQIVGELILVGGTGAFLILLGRRPAR